MRIKILYIVPSWFTLRYHLRGQLSYLKSKGFDVDVVCEADSRAKEASMQEGVMYYPVDIIRESAPINDIKSFYQLFHIMKKNKYDAVNCSTKKGGFLGVLAAKLAGGTRCIYVIRGLTLEKTNYIKMKILLLIEKVICTIADRVVFLSKSNKELFIKKRICSDAKSVILGGGSINGIDTEFFKKNDINMLKGIILKKKYNIPENAYVFGFVGRLVIEKGIKELVMAWEELRATFTNIHLLMIAPPEIEAVIIEFISRLQMDSNVHFTGFLSNPVSGYAAMDCLLLPSYGEGLSNVIIEAGAMEVPAIATNVLGCTDVVVHNQTGILVEAKNHQALANAMQMMLASPKVTQVLGKNARERYTDLFQQQVIWTGYENLYNDIITKNKSDTLLKNV